MVFEIYPLPRGEALETGTRGVRLGFVVADVQAAVLQDPDGRKVNVTEREG